MRRALRSSLLPLIALIAVAAGPARLTKEDVARRGLEQAERTRAAEQAAQRNAAARAAAAAAETQRLTEDRIAAAARLRQAEAATADAAARTDELAARRREAEASLAARGRDDAAAAAADRAAVAVPRRDPAGGAGAGGRHAAWRSGAARPGRSAWSGGRGAAPRAGQARFGNRGLGWPKRRGWRRHWRHSSPKPRRSTGRSPRPRRGGDRRTARPRRRRSAPQAKRHAPTRCAAWWRNSMPSVGRRAGAVARGGGATASADLERPAGAGTIASSAQPRGQLTAPVAGTIVRAWGDATEGGPATGISYRAPPAARVVAACARSRGVRFPIPQLRATVDRRLRRWLPCRARRLRAARRQGRAGRGRRRTGRRHAELGTRRIRQPARAVCRVAT